MEAARRQLCSAVQLGQQPASSLTSNRPSPTHMAGMGMGMQARADGSPARFTGTPGFSECANSMCRTTAREA